LPVDCLVRNPSFVQDSAQLGANTRVRPLPEGTKRIIVRIASGLRFRARLFITEERRQCPSAPWWRRHQIQLAVRAFRKALPVFRPTFWTDHPTSLHHPKPAAPRPAILERSPR